MSEAPPAGPGNAEPGADSAEPRAGTPHRRAAAILFGIALTVLAADAATKHLALGALEDREPVRLLGGAVYLSLTRNSGAAWSIGADHTWVFPLITLGVVGWIVWMALRLRSLPWAISLGLVLGGALGNFTDRVFRAPGWFVGHVVDMVSVFAPYGRVFPVFNLADSALVCGVLLALALELTGRQRDGSRIGHGEPTDEAAAQADAGQRERA
ncbi:signal peptidase II [Micromonospora sp. M71_S20]|uniref:signal peptidase II n=1 Tax=Micromonospora sp. M71_S20 TaxID=592872 RepID=UPI000EAB6B9D|nr:signal peptidase II [Micromonospora sp. M71_S20]RLK12337.1 signal peptidase II [Micromonospora sp. M71_S20]